MPKLSSSRGSCRRVSKRLRNAIFETRITKLFSHNLLRVDPLSGIHDRSGFDSRVEPLDRYLKAQSGHDDRTRLRSIRHASLPRCLHHEAEDLARFRAMPEAEQKAADMNGLEAMGELGKANAASFPDTGGMVGKTKRVTKGGVSDAQNAICGYIVVGPKTSTPPRVSLRTPALHDLPRRWR